MSDSNDVINKIAEYYTRKLAAHGATPRGVDWNSLEAQTVRFDQLLKIIQREPFSIADYGCGYGALAPYLAGRFDDFRYTGCDVSSAMIAQAQSLHGGDPRFSFTGDPHAVPRSDYGVASGIFSVKMDIATADWEAYIESTLERIASNTGKGFAFNMLTAYSDPERMRPDLYYADPHRYFDLCRERFSRNIALMHDYQLYEFTILVRL